MFKPEFLNRLDDMIVFHKLERNDLLKIVDLREAGAEYVIEGARVEERRSSSELSELAAVCAGYSFD
jgi:ATP-dependent Clp protease ATP-binding subunit ClpC